MHNPPVDADPSVYRTLARGNPKPAPGASGLKDIRAPGDILALHNGQLGQ